MRHNRELQFWAAELCEPAIGSRWFSAKLPMRLQFECHEEMNRKRKKKRGFVIYIWPTFRELPSHPSKQPGHTVLHRHPCWYFTAPVIYIGRRAKCFEVERASVRATWWAIPRLLICWESSIDWTKLALTIGQVTPIVLPDRVPVSHF